MKHFNSGGRNSLNPLSISRSLLLIRDLYSTKVAFGTLTVWYKATSACTSGSASKYDRKSANRSEEQCLVQFTTMSVHRGTGVVAPKTELSQSRSESCPWFLEVPLRDRFTIRDFHEWHSITLVSFSARIPTSPRGILSTTVSATNTRNIRIPCWWRREW